MKLKSNKKGVEIAANTLVILIISILIFGYGLYFLYSTWSSVEEQQKIIDSNLKTQIDSLLKSENKKILVYPLSQQAKSGKMISFGIGIKNLDSQDAEFTIKTEFSQAYTSDGKKKLEIEEENLNPNDWLGNFKELTEIIPAKQSGEAILSLQSKTAPSGNYVFKITVLKNKTNHGEYSITVIIK